MSRVLDANRTQRGGDPPRRRGAVSLFSLPAGTDLRRRDQRAHRSAALPRGIQPESATDRLTRTAFGTRRRTRRTRRAFLLRMLCYFRGICVVRGVLQGTTHTTAAGTRLSDAL